MIRFLLAAGARLLPPGHRDRWREETAALLAEVHGARRLRYAADVLVKLPLLRREVALRSPVAAPGPSRAAGLVMLAITLASAVAATQSRPGRYDLAMVLTYLAPLAVAPAAALRAATVAAGPVRAALTIVACGLGSVCAALVVLLDDPDAGLLVAGRPAYLSVLLLALLPAGWLVAAAIGDARRGTAPAALCLAGLVAGLTLALVLLAGGWITLAPGESADPWRPVGFAATAVLLPSYLIWSVWTSLRLLFPPAAASAARDALGRSAS